MHVRTVLVNSFCCITAALLAMHAHNSVFLFHHCLEALSDGATK